MASYLHEESVGKAAFLVYINQVFIGTEFG